MTTVMWPRQRVAVVLMDVPCDARPQGTDDTWTVLRTTLVELSEPEGFQAFLDGLEGAVDGELSLEDAIFISDAL